MSKETLCDDFRFNGIMNPAATASAVDGPWSKADTSDAGAPVVAADAGLMNLTLAANEEVENICLYQGDKLSYDIDEIIQADFWVKLTASLDAAISAAFGLASARNDAIDSIAAGALFRCIGSNAVVVETDDSVVNNDDVATGQSLSTTIRRCCITFKEGVVSNSGALSTGGKSDVRFYMENSQGLLRRVAAGTRFDMSNYSAGLQPFFQLQKTSDAAVATLSIQRVKIAYRRN